MENENKLVNELNNEFINAGSFTFRAKTEKENKKAFIERSFFVNEQEVIEIYELNLIYKYNL